MEPEFEELDALEETILQDQAWEGYLLDVKLNAPQLLTRLDDIGITVIEMKSAFSALSQYPDVVLVYEETSKPELSKVSTLAKPTYQTKSPTGLKEHEVDFQIKREAGGGRAWGLVIHKVFEELVNGKADLDSVIELALEENGKAPERKEEVIKVWRLFANQICGGELPTPKPSTPRCPSRYKLGLTTRSTHK